MAKETVTKSARFYCVSLTPDICKTPIGASTPPLPYNVIGEFYEASSVSPNVKAHSEPVFLHGRSKVPSVKGDNPGKAGGVKSGTVGKEVESKTRSSTLRSNSKETTQVGRNVWMNLKNTVGAIYERAEQAARPRLMQLAREYKESGLSQAMHEVGEDAVDKGGDVLAGSAVLGAGAVVATATGVGAPAGAVMATGAAVAAPVGSAVTAFGAAVDTGASILDVAADALLSGKDFDFASALKSATARFGWNVIGRKAQRVSAALGIQITPGKHAGAAGGRTNSASSRGNGNGTGPNRDGSDGGKTRTKKGEKRDKPSDCCPKNSAPGGKRVSSRHPVHFGTGEEVLYQTDFVIDGPIPIEWTRCYRSGSELEDWGVLGARWATPFTSSIAVTDLGIIFVDDTGRPVLLPGVRPGEKLDNRKEGFFLSRTSAEQFVLTWRDGSTDTYTREPSADTWLPHGYHAVNAMRPAGAPTPAERFVLVRSQGRDGRGISIERLAEAKAGEPMMRIRTDEDLVLEVIRAGSENKPQFNDVEDPCGPSRIGRVEEVRANGKRICHVRYRYEAAPHRERDATGPCAQLWPRFNLVAQTNIAGHERTYAYSHNLLTAYTTYTGFAHTLEWISLDAIRERWTGNAGGAAELATQYPVTLHNSYQARAIATATADGLDGVRIEYVSEDRTRVTEADGGVLEYLFDENWLATEVFRLGGQHPVSLGRRRWDDDGMLLSEYDAAGRGTDYRYDAAGNLIWMRDALRRETRFEYDAHNQPISITDALGNVSRLEYDGHGNLTARTDALGHVTRYSYDTKQRLARMQDAKGGNKEIGYDSAGRVSSYTDCSGYRTYYRYDECGRLDTVVDPLEQSTRYEYNESGALTRVSGPDNAQEQFEYDAEGRLLVFTDAAGYQTHYRYNGHGLLIERTDALGYKVQYRYDTMLRLSELINQNGERYRFSYDAEGRLLTETGFDGLLTRYAYDGAGHMIAVDCGGRRKVLNRGVMGHLLNMIADDGSVCRFQYDALDRLTAATSPNAHNEFRYDALGQLIEERSAYFITAPVVDATSSGPREPDAAFTLTHAYDELGNRVQTVLPGGERIDILRYGSGHWHGTLLDGETVVDIERDRLHREKLRHYGPNHVLSAAREYDPASRITRMTLHRKGKPATQCLRERELTYDPVGNLLEIKNGSSGDGADKGDWTYRYDPLGQLLGAVQFQLNEKFAFDPAGNLIDNPLQKSGGSDSSCGSNPGPVIPVLHNQIKRYRGQTYSYDGFGNVIRKSSEVPGAPELDWTLDLAYDSENRVTSAWRETRNTHTTAKYWYDVFGRRIAKQVTQVFALEQPDEPPLRPHHFRTLFVWDGDVLMQEANATQLTSYLYEPDSFIPLARVQAEERASPELEFFSCDHIGTPREVFTRDGSVKWDGDLSAWGQSKRVNFVACEPQPIRFQGQYSDIETGLHYNRYRYYDPSAARFLSQDPIGLSGGFNTYVYAPNSTGWVDPRGLKGCGPHPKCDPCYGVNPAKWASQWQGRKNYPGKDNWINVVLPAETSIFGGYPGQSGFYFDVSTLNASGFERKRLYDSLQVRPHRDMGYRPEVQEYKLKKDTCVAVSIASAQDTADFGNGGGTQFFLSNYRTALKRSGPPRLMR